MKTIKNKNKDLYPKPIRGFPKYRLMLKALLSDNKHVEDFIFMGCVDKSGKEGLLVHGSDINDVSKIDNFWTTEEITNYFNKNIKDNRWRE